MGYEAIKELESCIERFGDVFGAAIVCAKTRTCLKVLRALAKSPGPLYTRQLLQLIGDVSWGKAGRVGKDPEAALKLLEDLRLIRRWEEECWVESQKKPGLKVKKKCKFNEITELGRIVYKVLVKFEELNLI